MEITRYPIGYHPFWDHWPASSYQKVQVYSSWPLLPCILSFRPILGPPQPHFYSPKKLTQPISKPYLALLGGTQTQLDGAQSWPGGSWRWVGGLDSQLEGPWSQLEGARNQLSGLQSQLRGPRIQLGGFQSQLGGSQRKLGGPLSQLGGPLQGTIWVNLSPTQPIRGPQMFNYALKIYFCTCIENKTVINY